MAKKKGKKKSEELQIKSVFTEAAEVVCEMIREGWADVVILHDIKNKFPVLNEAALQLVLHNGSAMIADEYARDSKSVISLHVKRYNKEIEKLMNPDAIYEDMEEEDAEDNVMTSAKRRKIRIAQLFCLLEVMLAKERVLQLHTKSTQVRVFNKLNAKIKEKKVMFDLSSLTLQEKIEFLALVQKCKKSDNEVFGVKLAKEKVETIDVEAEVVENNNIALVEQINQPEEIKTKVKKDLGYVTNKMQERLKQIAEKQFKAKGGGKGGPKEIDYTEQ